MKFLVTWRLHEDKRHEVFEAFSQMTPDDDEAQLDGMNLIGRWHDLVSFTGAAIVETDSEQKLANWLLNWNGVCDIDAVAVLDDEETRAIGRARSAE